MKDDALTLVLNSLTDEKVGQLMTIFHKAIPDKFVTYSSHAIFASVNPEKFVDGFVKLSNEKKADVIQFVRTHYHQAFRVSNAKDFVYHYEEDLNNLPKIVELLRKVADKENLVNKVNIEALAQTLTESGDTIQVLVMERDNDRT